MLSYCLCGKYIESKNPKVMITKNEKILLLSKCAVCNMQCKKPEFIKNQESSGLPGFLGIRTPLS